MILFDLETEGLDPYDCAIRCFGAFDTDTKDVTVRIVSNPEGEERLIAELLGLFERSRNVGGWNISEFDLPFLRDRGRLYDLELPLDATGEIGKYGNPRYEFSRSGFRMRDLAYEYQQTAAALECEWSLQEVAQTYGWLAATPLMGEDMPAAPLTQVAAHCLDDIDAMAFLLESGTTAIVEDQSSYMRGMLE